MLNTLPKHRSSGFSLIELLIGFAVMGILLAVAAPNFKAWLLNAQIRNAAESIQLGMQKARAEAVSRNTNVAFVLGAGTDTSWTVSVVGDITPIDKRLSSEGSTNVERVIAPPGTTAITFDNTGRPLISNADGSLPITSVTLDINPTLLPAIQSQDLVVTVSFGGKIRMCDPNLSYPNVRAC